MPSSTRVPERDPQRFRPTEYAHIVLRTQQPDVLAAWYCQVLGMDVVMRHPVITFLTWDDAQDRLAIVTVPPDVRRTEGTHGMHHVAFAVRSLRELTGQYRVLLASGIVPEVCMNHGVATSMYYRDPDGNQVELTVEAFGDVTALNDWLGSGAFDANPVGVPVDPIELCRRVDAGEAEVDILRPDGHHQERLQAGIAAMTAPAPKQGAKV